VCDSCKAMRAFTPLLGAPSTQHALVSATYFYLSLSLLSLPCVFRMSTHPLSSFLQYTFFLLDVRSGRALSYALSLPSTSPSLSSSHVRSGRALSYSLSLPSISFSLSRGCVRSSTHHPPHVLNIHRACAFRSSTSRDDFSGGTTLRFSINL
jgi:hypothetical protein